MNKRERTQAVKDLAKKSGAALVGVASIDRFDPMPPYYDRVPEGQHPLDFLPTARSVISYAQPILNPAMDAPARLNEMHLEMYPDEARAHWLESLYQKVAHANQDFFLLAIGQIVGQYLMELGYDSMVFPTEGVHFEIDGKGDAEWMQDSKFHYISGPISHRHCATRAGLGEFGYNNLVLTREFGARQRFNTIVTEAELEPDPLISEPICLRDRCMLCMKACHMNAFAFRDDPARSDYRDVAAVRKDVIFIDTPVKTDTRLCRERMGEGNFFPLRGDCVRACPVPRLPKHPTERLKRLYAQWVDRPAGYEGAVKTDD